VGWQQKAVAGGCGRQGMVVGRPAPTLRGRQLAPSLRATSARAAVLPPALLPALEAATGTARLMPGAGAADAGMMRGCQGGVKGMPKGC